jgi:hypothetical protein
MVRIENSGGALTSPDRGVVCRSAYRPSNCAREEPQVVYAVVYGR